MTMAIQASDPPVTDPPAPPDEFSDGPDAETEAMLDALEKGEVELPDDRAARGDGDGDGDIVADVGTTPPAAPSGQEVSAAWEKFEEREQRSVHRETALEAREAKVALIEASTGKPVEYFEAAIMEKFGEEKGQEFLDHYVLSRIAKKVPELAEQLPDDLKFAAQHSERDAKIQALEDKLEAAEADRVKNDKRQIEDAKIATLKTAIKDGWEKDYAAKHPFLACEENPAEIIHDFWTLNSTMKFPDAIAKLEELSQKKAGKYKHLLGGQTAPPAPRAPQHRANLHGASPGTPPAKQNFEDLSDEASIALLVKGLEADNK